MLGLRFDPRPPRPSPEEYPLVYEALCAYRRRLAAPPCSVDLNGPYPLVYGNAKKPLSPKTRMAVQLLIDAYPNGLTTRELR